MAILSGSNSLISTKCSTWIFMTSLLGRGMQLHNMNGSGTLEVGVIRVLGGAAPMA